MPALSPNLSDLSWLLACAGLAGAALVLVMGVWVILVLRRLDVRIAAMQRDDERLDRLLREEMAQNREEAAAANHRLTQTLLAMLGDLSQDSSEEAEKLREVLFGNLRAIQSDASQHSEALRRTVDEKLGEVQGDARQGREEMGTGLRRFGETLKEQFDSIGALLRNQLEVVSGQFAHQLATLTGSNESVLERLRATIEERILALQADNQQKLEQMRQTVDEKLHSTLEQRLGESFRLVSERLELVHQGLGEMQTLASGVGDLKRVLANVKVRGTWGEVQLEKFPLEDYQRLIEAQDAGLPDVVDAAGRALEQRLRSEAKAICEKYLEPPHSTDFGLLFLPIEGLYAEVIRRPGLCDALQRDYRVTVTGPTTLTAILNSLQMGFRTLAIEQRSSEVWRTLAAVKAEFQKFGGVLEKTRRKLDEVRTTIDQAETRTRQITRKLGQVEQLPSAGLGDPATDWMPPDSVDAD